MSDIVIFEHSHRGEPWRLVVSEYQGRRFANFRKWYWSADDLKPAREGCTFPLKRLADLRDAIDDFLTADRQAAA